MANVEMRLLAKVLEEQELRPLIDAGVKLDDFKDEEAQQIFRSIRDYFRAVKTSGQVPSLDYISDENPTIDIPRPEKTSLKALLSEFQNYALKNSLLELSTYIMDNSANPGKALDHIARIHAKLSKEHRTSKDFVLADAMEEVWNRYETRKQMKGYVGIPYPWKVFNDRTGGILDAEFVVLYGRPKSMKTWVLMNIACHAYDSANRKVLVVTKEMKAIQILERCMCILIGAPYTALQQGRLHEIEVPEGGTMEDRLIDLRKNLKTDEETCRLESGFGKSFIITEDRSDTSTGGVLGLKQKIRDHRPNLMCVDAMYRMENDRTGRRSAKWDDQGAISQDTKEAALEFNIPIIGTNQANRDSEDAAGKSVRNISFSDAYGQECDMAIEVIKKPTRDPEVNELALIITAAREVNMTGFAIHGNAATTFGSIMTKKRDAEGLVELDERGRPIMVPVEFHEYRDVKNFFKDSQDPDQVAPRGERAAAAAAAFREANKSRH